MYSVKNAKEFRKEAREALRGNWWIAVLTGLVAAILGASTTMNATTIGDGGTFSSIMDTIHLYPGDQQPVIALVGLILSAVVFLFNLAIFIIAGPITFGYINFNIKMLNGEKPKFKDLFLQFKRFKEGFSVHFFRWLFVFLWTLAGCGVAVVAMIPFALFMAWTRAGETFFMLICYGLGLAAGIFIISKMLDYAMAPYIAYECPGIGGNEALKKSKRMMYGNKWRLVGLILSFIGWSLLSQLPYIICALCWQEAIVFSLPLCVGALWVRAYQEAAYAAFYRQLMEEENRTYHLNGGPEEKVLNSGHLEDVGSVVEHPRWNY